MHITHPPQIPSYGITRDVRMRFQSNAAVNQSITFQNLLDTVLVASGTTTGYDLFDQVRVNSVEVWAQSVVGTPVTAIVSFAGQTAGSQGDRKTHTDTSMGLQPAHIKCHPDPLTQAGQFQADENGVEAFLLDVPANSVIDVSMSLRQPVTGQSNVTQNPLAGASAGVVYYRGLDGKASATTSLPVVGAASVQ
jgi:hypothetical protein